MKKLPFSYRSKSQTVTYLKPYIPRGCITLVTLLPFYSIEIIINKIIKIYINRNDTVNGNIHKKSSANPLAL
nr:MAG TPA: hypothetical protein [Caudoviricetes sp.]